MEVAFGKCNLGNHGEHTFGFATFAFTSGFTSPTQIDDLRKFVNKLAGFARGDVDNNNVINLLDLVKLNAFVNAGGNGPVPFRHLGDVNCDGLVNPADATYLMAYLFTGGPAPRSTFMF
jgi:hypothetical protein